MSNFLAWGLGMVSLGAISLGSFQTGAILLAGLFCYDVFWVFGTDVSERLDAAYFSLSLFYIASDFSSSIVCVYF